MNLLQETKFIMKKYGITANKRLGQNFLINDEVVSQIVTSSNINKEDLVIEIGPGLGTLTKPLLENAGKVICIELDSRMIEILEDRFKLYKNFIVINEDVLKVKLKELIKENKKERYKKCKNSCKFTILHYNSNYNEITRRQIRYRKHNCNDTKRSS